MPYEMLRGPEPRERHRCRPPMWVGRCGSLARCTICGLLYQKGIFRWFMHKFTAEALGFPPLGREVPK